MIEQDQNEINAILKTVEDKRLEFVSEIDKKRAKEEKTKYIIIAILSFVSIGLCYFFLEFITFLFFSYVFIIIVILRPDESEETDNIKYREIAVEILLKSLYPEITYKKAWNWSLFKKEVEQSLLLAGELSSAARLSGITKNGKQFECVEIVQEINSRAGSSQIKRIFFKLDCPDFFSSPIIIRQKSIITSIGDFIGYKGLVINGIDPVFDKKYTIGSQDMTEAKSLLTLEFLQPIVNLSKQHLEIHWSFVGNRIYFATSTKIGLFSSLNLNNSVLDSNILERFHEDVKFCQNISEELGQQIDIISGRLKIGDLDKNTKIKDLEDPYQHLVEE